MKVSASMDERRSFRLLAWTFILLLSVVQHGRLHAELRKKVHRRIPEPRRSPNSQLPTESNGAAQETDEVEPHINLHFTGKEMTNVYFWEKCSQDAVESVTDNEMYILSSRPQPNPYFCVQKFRVDNASSVLHLHCYSLDLRFSCSYEVLKVNVNNEVHSLCSGSLPPVQYAGRFMEITYDRRLFGLHGGYTCALVARASNLPEIVVSMCGISENDQEHTPVTLKVVDGVDVEKNAFPWMVLLEVKAAGYSFLCGGTLLSDSIVTTAAHCLADNVQEILIGLGKILLKEDDEAGSVWMTSRNFTVHPKFDGKQIINDIGLIFLPSKVMFTDNIRPACLPSASMRRDNLVGYTATAIGWGSTKFDGPLANNLQKVNLVIWTNEDCEAAWSEFKIRIQETEMCALSEGKDTCNGDSGGPLLIKYEGHWTLVGITSYGFECASPGIPGVYSRVTEYVPWIRSYMPRNITSGDDSTTKG